MYHYFLFFIFL